MRVLHHRRLREWVATLREEGLLAWNWPTAKMFLKMAWALRGGFVTRAVWRERIRTCRRCPIYAGDLKQCRLWMSAEQKLGCGCYVPFKALSPAPYVGEKGAGCWLRATVGRDAPNLSMHGWGAAPGYFERLASGRASG